MRSGPKAILYQSTLFRTTELVWVKVAPLAPWRELIRWGLVGCGLAFYMAIASAKDSYLNIEGFLGLLAWHVGYYLQPDVRLASTGDLQESYEGRGGSGSARTFRQWVSALSEGENECKLRSQRYQHWINLQRVAWAGPCWIVEWYPLVLVPVFLGYKWILANFKLPFENAILSDMHLLTFENPTGWVHFLCLLIAFLGLAGWLTSISPGAEVRACGGLTDRFALSGTDRQRFFEQLAGNQRPAQAEENPPASVPTPPQLASTPSAKVVAEAIVAAPAELAGVAAGTQAVPTDTSE